MASDLPTLQLSARRGASADIPLRMETGTLSFVAISAMTKTAPLRVTATSHGILDGWYVAIIDAKGMTELNAEDSNSIRDYEFHRVTYVDADKIDFDGISSASFHTYTSGGYLAFYEQMDLSGYTSARMDVKHRVGGDILLALDTTGGTLEIDDATSTVWIRLEDDTLDNLPAGEYVFDIELVSSSEVDAICSAESVFKVLDEVTTSV